MWDDAKTLAKEMRPGEYWYLDNVRAKWNPVRYMEGTMQLQQKSTRLDEMASQDWPHLAALLGSVSRASRPDQLTSSLVESMRSGWVSPPFLDLLFMRLAVEGRKKCYSVSRCAHTQLRTHVMQ